MTLPLQSFIMKHPGTCSGMFWRGNPFTNVSSVGAPDWPKNGAILRGVIHENVPKKPESNDTWLEVKAVKQKGAKDFVEVPDNCWMIFDQGGKLLFEVKE